jgi:branched-chain amino acid transport system substrate-binding protein
MTKGTEMRLGLLATVFTIASAAASTVAADELRIGFLNTTTGGGSVIGSHIENGWKLGLERLGWTKDGDKLGGVPTTIFYGDDQLKTDVGKKEVEKFLTRNKVQVVAGIIWSNVMMAVADDVFSAQVLLVSANAGPAPLAGEKCNPLWVSTAFQNDQMSEAVGELANKDGVKATFLLAPNYQGGKDNVQGFKRTYKGKVVGEILFKVGETDFQAELSRVRAEKPEGVYVFAPAAMGVAFVKQWTASGLGKDIKLYTAFAIDGSTLPAIGDAAIGTFTAGHWDADSKDARSQAFLKAYQAKFNSTPSFYAVAAYDAATAIDLGVKATGGKLNDMSAVARAIRKGTLSSPRGDLKYNHNGFLIQPYYQQEVIKQADGKPWIKGGQPIFTRADSYGDQCPANKRL